MRNEDPWQRNIRSVLRLDLTGAGRYARGRHGVNYASLSRGVGLNSLSAYTALTHGCERKECVRSVGEGQLITNLGNRGSRAFIFTP